MNILLRLRQMPVTILLIVINTLLFCYSVLTGMDIWNGDGEVLLRLGGNYWPLTMQGEYWRLFTSMFLHAGLPHLLTNMIGLLIAGIFLESVLRTWRYTSAYVITGFIADYASIRFHPYAIGVGASGAIFGIYGVFLALLTTRLFRPSVRKGFLVFIALFAGLNIIAAFFSGGIDNIAHLAGFLSGILMGYLLFFTLSKTAGDRLPG
ncbi:rhomboid family intramembrane serine protease [Chitinophaga nivalis]|uniref:Rhomboid family intramembrane serine protease n=1 Tax=Chitinophaga nivalis TaxID=2991709 RepID=A0ABT3ISU3_9BACT|nr:rhomboid family intramembrane serine protease [Chitinophaga nivalis]MCW3463263.1 rhomboid family intramembrane serine protease [Chitinophaga nivalis]MCW3487047.1 rhomboid family intramembrane serine protease [Chitinophaga nivalis]